MENANTPATIGDDDFNKYTRDTMLALNNVKVFDDSRIPVEKNLFAAVAELKSETIPEGIKFTDSLQFHSLNAFIDTCTTYKIVKDKLTDLFEDFNKFASTKPNPTEKANQKKLIQTFALYVGTTVGLNELAKLGDFEKGATIKINQDDYKKARFDFEKPSGEALSDEEMFQQMASKYLRVLVSNNETKANNAIKNGKDYAVFTQGFLDALNMKSFYEKDDGKYKDFLKLLEDQTFKVKDLTFKGFKKDSLDVVIDVSNLPDINDAVAMAEVIKTGKRAIDNAMCYDFEEKKNSQDPFRKIIYVVGPSGCGKSFVIEGLMRYAVEQGQKHKKPVNVKKITSDMYKTSYMNETGNKVNAIFKDFIYKRGSLNVAYFPDFDTQVPSRDQAKGGNSIEAANTFGVWLDNLSGSKVPKDGFYVMFVDTNYQIDDAAMLNRLGKPIIGVGAKTGKEFVKLIKGELRDGFKPNKNYVKLNDKEWDNIGTKCEQYEKEVKLSGRDIRNICEALSDYANDFDIPDEFKDMNHAEQLEYKKTKQLYNPITSDLLTKELVSYVENRKEAVDREEREKKEKMRKEWQLSLDVKKSMDVTRQSLFLELAQEYMPKDIYESLAGVLENGIKLKQAAEQPAAQEKK